MPEGFSVARLISTSQPPACAAFSLIELMVALAIAAIIAVFAVPSYHDHILRARLPEATSSLLLTAMRLEQHYQEHRSYATAATAAAGAAATGNAACGVSLPASDRFAFRCDVLDGGQSFLLSAAGQEGTSMAGFSYSLDHLGAQRTLSLPADWGKSPVPCWVERRNGQC